MIAYHNDPKIKERILGQLKTQYEKGMNTMCAVGCTKHFDEHELYQMKVCDPYSSVAAYRKSLHFSSHEEYENQFGIPVELSELIHEIELSFKHRKSFLVNFQRVYENKDENKDENKEQWLLSCMEAFNVGADTSDIVRKVLLRLLNDKQYGILHNAKLITQTPKYLINEVVTKISHFLEINCVDDMDSYKETQEKVKQFFFTDPYGLFLIRKIYACLWMIPSKETSLVSKLEIAQNFKMNLSMAWASKKKGDTVRNENRYEEGYKDYLEYGDWVANTLIEIIEDQV